VIARLCASSLAGILLFGQGPEPSNVDRLTREKEAAIGARLAAEIQRQTTDLADSAVLEYIQCVERRLTPAIPDGWNWRLAVIRDEHDGGSTHEPLAFLGGYIFVPASLLLAAENEAELAGMLAHSMAHVAESQEIRLGPRAQEANVAAIPNAVYVGWQESGAGAISPENLKVMRGYELEADRYAVKIIAAAGYDPVALVNYVRRTQQARVFSLPPREKRIAALEAAIVGLSPAVGRPCGDFNAIQTRVRGLVTPPPSPPPTLYRKSER
jgi:predicted Zn-dependent protease